MDDVGSSPTLSTINNKKNNMNKTQLDPLEAFFILETSFPHIYTKLRMMWGTYECDDYIKNLVISNRDSKTSPTDRRSRQGFKPEIMSAILAIASFSARTANRREPFSNY